MKVHSRLSTAAVPFLLLTLAALPAAAGVNYQCPANLLTQGSRPGVCGVAGRPACSIDIKNPASSTDPGCTNPTDPNYFTTCKPQLDPVTGQPSGATTDPLVVCRSITCGDGHVNMADGSDTYIFGFDDVTGVPESLILTRGMTPIANSFPLGAAEFPAPTMFAREGQDLYLTLTNVGMRERPDLADAHTVHYHGFPNAGSVFDGEPMASFGINMTESLTYFYRNIYPGTYMWHCHVEAAEHMQMGMLGNLYILPKQDGTAIRYPAVTGNIYSKFAYDDCPAVADPMCGSTGYDVTFFLQITGFDPAFHAADHTYNKLSFSDMIDTYGMLNGRGYPDTVNPGAIVNAVGAPSQPIPAIPMTINGSGNSVPVTITHGNKVLLHLSSLATVDFSTLSVLGIPFRVVGQGAQLLRSSTGVNTSYATGSVTLGGGEGVDILLDTTNVAPGTYFIYTKNLNKLSNNTEDFGGIMTEIVVN
jgi:FtsP/CotA-like multicopper oxidase with cupredoxin domain